MEKLGVVLEQEMTKTGSIGSQCPKCGSKLEEPNKCNVCGTEPFEKRPEPTPQPKK